MRSSSLEVMKLFLTKLTVLSHLKKKKEAYLILFVDTN